MNKSNIIKKIVEGVRFAYIRAYNRKKRNLQYHIAMDKETTGYLLLPIDDAAKYYINTRINILIDRLYHKYAK